MKTFVEFYFPGFSCAGQNEKEVSSRNVTEIGTIPKNAISCRFFSKDENQNKLDFSAYHFFGKEYEVQEFKEKYPQLAADSSLVSATRIVRTTNVNFYPLKDDDIVVGS